MEPHVKMKIFYSLRLVKQITIFGCQVNKNMQLQQCGIEIEQKKNAPQYNEQSAVYWAANILYSNDCRKYLLWIIPVSKWPLSC